MLQGNRRDSLVAHHAGQPRPRLTHEYSSRVGQAWREGKVQVITEDKWGRHEIEDLPLGNFKCPKHDEIVRIDVRGFAFCPHPKCGRVFNDGLAPPPKIYDRGEREFYKTAKA